MGNIADGACYDDPKRSITNRVGWVALTLRLAPLGVCGVNVDFVGVAID